MQYSRNSGERSGSQVVNPIFFFQTENYRPAARDCYTLIIVNQIYVVSKRHFSRQRGFLLKKKQEIGPNIKCYYFTM